MGLFSLFDDSDKSSSTSTSMTDNRRVLGDGAVSMELEGQAKVNSNGVLVDGFGNTYTSTVVMTDQGAFEKAAELARLSVEKSAEVMQSSLSGALEASARATDGALDFGESAMGMVDSVVGNAVDVIARRAGEESDSLRSIYESALGAMNTGNARLGDAYADAQGRGALTDKMLMLAIGGAVLIAIFAIKGAK